MARAGSVIALGYIQRPIGAIIVANDRKTVVSDGELVIRADFVVWIVQDSDDLIAAGAGCIIAFHHF